MLSRGLSRMCCQTFQSRFLNVARPDISTMRPHRNVSETTFSSKRPVGGATKCSGKHLLVSFCAWTRKGSLAATKNLEKPARLACVKLASQHYPLGQQDTTHRESEDETDRSERKDREPQGKGTSELAARLGSMYRLPRTNRAGHNRCQS